MSHGTTAMFSRRNCFSSRCALQCQRIINWTHTPSRHATFTYATLLLLLISILVLHILLNPIPSSNVSLHLRFTHTSKPHPIFTCQISSCFVRTTNTISRIHNTYCCISSTFYYTSNYISSWSLFIFCMSLYDFSLHRNNDRQPTALDECPLNRINRSVKT